MKEETKRKKDDEKEKKKDYYTPIMICQIVLAGLLFLLYSVFVSPSDSVKNELLSHLDNEMYDTSEMVSAAKNYLSDGGAWAVFGDNVTYENTELTTAEETEITKRQEQNKTESEAQSETTAADLSGTGGEDMKIYEAAKNTSFARFKTTAPAIKPVEDGRYTSYFGYRINPITGKFAFHTGLDIAAEEGTKIRAAYSGRVTKIGEDDRAGKYIFLTHSDGFVTFYCHCSEILAEEGSVIRQGETIARVGSTGWSTGPHLHFEIRKENIRYNPIFILENDV